MKLRAIFLIFAGLFLVMAIGVYWYNSTPVQKQATKIDDNVFQIDIPGDGWVDTGIWVNPNFKVRADANQPFYLGVDKAWEEARLVDAQNQRFYSAIWTFPDPVPLGLLPEGTAWIESRGKIYLYADNPATVKFVIEPLSSETVSAIKLRIKKDYGEHESKLRNISGIIVVVLFGAALIVIAVAKLKGYW